MSKTSLFAEPHFQNDEAARAMLESILWPDGPVCVHCGVVDHAYKTKRPGVFRCAEKGCRKDFSVTMKTVMERSHIALHKWLQAFHLMTSSKKGVSAHQLHRTLSIGYEAAWFMAHRIRESMQDDGSPLGGPGKIVESDEAFVGGKKHKRLSGKVAPMKKVMTLVERDGRARSFHVANLNHNNIRGAIVTNVERASKLMTDDARVYWPIGREFAGGHGTTLHANREFARPGGVHSNTAENFFSILKRGVVGTYHHWSPAHLHRYLAEFDFRYSTKHLTDVERTAIALCNARGKRLMYRQPSSLAA